MVFRSVPDRDALERKGIQRLPHKRLSRRLEEFATAVGGGYHRLQMPLRLALAVTEPVTGHRLGAPRGGTSPPFNASLVLDLNPHGVGRGVQLFLPGFGSIIDVSVSF